MIGKALKDLPREEVQLGTKFGISMDDMNQVQVRGDPQYVRQCIRRLDVDYIDLYYQHRVDKSVPIEETMGELKKLVEEGKIRELGIGVVAYSPLGYGFFGGKGMVESLPS